MRAVLYVQQRGSVSGGGPRTRFAEPDSGFPTRIVDFVFPWKAPRPAIDTVGGSARTAKTLLRTPTRVVPSPVKKTPQTRASGQPNEQDRQASGRAADPRGHRVYERGRLSTGGEGRHRKFMLHPAIRRIIRTGRRRACGPAPKPRKKAAGDQAYHVRLRPPTNRRPWMPAADLLTPTRFPGGA